MRLKFYLPSIEKINYHKKDIVIYSLWLIFRLKKHTTELLSVSALSNQTIFPYTDLLLHDMRDELADNGPDFLANGNEWRTRPLWEIRLISTVNNHTLLLHDGRARSIEEAILWHGGEAERSKNLFVKLNAKKINQVLKYLNSF